MMSSGSLSLSLLRLGGGSDGEWMDGLLSVGEGRKRGVFDMRRMGTRDWEDEERLEAPAGGG